MARFTRSFHSSQAQEEKWLSGAEDKSFESYLMHLVSSGHGVSETIFGPERPEVAIDNYKHLLAWFLNTGLGEY